MHLQPAHFEQRRGALSGGATLQNNNWGLWRTQANSQRRMQVSLKLYW